MRRKAPVDRRTGGTSCVPMMWLTRNSGNPVLVCLQGGHRRGLRTGTLDGRRQLCQAVFDLGLDSGSGALLLSTDVLGAGGELVANDVELLLDFLHLRRHARW